MFPNTYEESRTRFRQDIDRVRQLWPNARLAHHRLSGDEDLSIDWIESEAVERNEKLLLFTTGEHGIEGYVGSAMLQLFIQEYLSRLDPHSTGLLLVHIINPWGMKHKRRTNAVNVDLNRNFLSAGHSLKGACAWDSNFDASFNPAYARLDSFLNPKGPIRSLFWDNLSFALKLIGRLALGGAQTIRQGTLLGQYRFPQGIYYGGESLQEETRAIMDLYRTHIGEYERIVHLDMHTGYGPRYQMSVVNSWMEPRESKELERQFSYPLVVKTTPAEFYSIRGDMIDYVYALARNEFPNQRLYSTSFEFGTVGDSTWAAIRSLRAMISENQLHWFGASESTRKSIEHDFQEKYAPQAEQWRDKAIADAQQAFEGILRAEEFLS